MDQMNTSSGSVAESGNTPLSKLSNLLITSFEREEIKNQTKTGMDVNRFVSELATWYEKFRNAMDYRDEEVVRRAAIERILKRRLLFGGSGVTIAPSLIRELLWARYFPEASISDEDVKKVKDVIDLHLEFRKELLANSHDTRLKVDEFTYDFLSSRLELMLNKSKDIELISNYIYHLLRKSVVIKDDSEEMRDIQLFIAIRKAFAKDDLAFLRFHLFEQYFGKLTKENVHEIAVKFTKEYEAFEDQLKYSLRDRIASYAKKELPPFLIFAEILRKERGKIRALISNATEFQNAVFTTTQNRYKSISSKVKTAIVRSVIFI